MNKKLCKYYLDEEVETLSLDKRICANCELRRIEEGRCPVKGRFVSGTGYCSEWIGREKE